MGSSSFARLTHSVDFDSPNLHRNRAHFLFSLQSHYRPLFLSTQTKPNPTHCLVPRLSSRPEWVHSFITHIRISSFQALGEPTMADSKTVHSPLVTYASMLSLLTLCPPFVILLWALSWDSISIPNCVLCFVPAMGFCLLFNLWSQTFCQGVLFTWFLYLNVEM